MHNHIVICGYGIKGQAALEYLRKHDEDRPAVAVDNNNEALEAANADGISGILGSAYDTEILKAAEIEGARTVIVALSTDERSVLTVLRARELNPKATIVASQYEPAEWLDQIPVPVAAEAIIDRLASQAYKIVIKGKKSMRETVRI